MGKKRVAVLDEAGQASHKKEHKLSLKKEKGVRVPGLKGGERVVAVVAEEPIEEPSFAEVTEGKPEEPKKKVQPRVRGKNYRAARAKVNPQKIYHPKEAVKLLQETSLGKFDGTAEAHFVLYKTGFKGQAELPYFTAKAKKVAIADEETLKKLESGKIDFDILLATPAFMPKLVKYAKVLGPKGLMPNPKEGTITENPEKALGKFRKPALAFKTEAEAPLIHTVFGKVSQKSEELEANLKALIKAISAKSIKKAVITSTMGPSIKIQTSGI